MKQQVRLTRSQLALRERLIKALRSGKYRQGQRALKTIVDEGNTRLCCLGVAADIMTRNKWEAPNAPHASHAGLRCGDNIYKTHLPPSLLKRLGLGPREQSALINANDVRDFDFNDIAFVLELATISRTPVGEPLPYEWTLPPIIPLSQTGAENVGTTD